MFVFDWEKTSHSGLKTSLLHGPVYHLINAVKLSLQSDRNTQHRTSIILVIYTAFGTVLARSFPTTKIPKSTNILLFEGLRFQNILVRHYYALLFLLVPEQANQDNLFDV
jgi:hypothetical protein